MAYVIARIDGALVAASGSKSSYTRTISRARVFRTREAAEADLCPDNEHVICVVLDSAGHALAPVKEVR